MVAHEFALRRRVERLLSDNFDPRDISEIYKGLRFRSVGAPSVKEIANFEAHGDFRDKGFATDRCKDLLAVFKSFLPAYGGLLHLDIVSPFFERALWHNLNLLSNSELKNGTGLLRPQAKEILTTAVRKYRFVNGRLVRQLLFTRKEHNLIMFLASWIILPPIFTDHVILKDLIQC